MTRVILLLVFLLAAAPALAQTCDRSPLVITNVTVWTPDGPRPGRDVVMRDGRIESVTLANAKRPAGVRSIDGSGHTLLPGLIDSHLHFSIQGGLPPNPGPRTDTPTIAAHQLLRSGVTSGRLHLASIEEAARMKALGQDPCALVPRLQVGGPALSGAATRDSAAFQGAPTVADAVAKVEKFAASGVDWLAIHDAHRFPEGVAAAIAAAARRNGVRLMASASTPEELAGALSMAPDTLDYLDRTTAAGYTDAALKQIQSHKNLIIVPTPGVPYRIVQYRNQPSLLAQDANFTLLAPSDRAHVEANAAKDLDGAEARRALDAVPTLPMKMKQLTSLGLPVALGTDAGSPMQFQPNAVWWELETWRANGLSHRAALTAATVNGARVLKLDDIGHLRPGARADFVLYRGNVEDGPFDAARVVAVGKGGLVVPR